MKTIVVYDSVYGNTEQIAKAIAGAAAGGATAIRASSSGALDLAPGDLLVVGSPTNGGRPTPSLQEFLGRLREEHVKGVRVAAFDTRYEGRFVKVFGFAAERIADSLKTKGGILAAPPEGFIVKGKKGPIKDGELTRAAEWAAKL